MRFHQLPSWKFRVSSLNIDCLVILGFIQEGQTEGSIFSELHRKLEVSVSLNHHKLIMDELEDREFAELASQVNGEKFPSNVQVKDILIV